MDPVQKKPSLNTAPEEPIELTSPISPPTDLSQMPLSQSQTDEAPSVSPEPSLPDEPEKVSQPEPLSEPAIPLKKTKSKNLLAIGAIFLISISLATSLAIINRPQTTEPEQSPQKPATTIPDSYQDSQVIATIGEEDIFGADFNYVLNTNYSAAIKNKSDLTEDIKTEIIDYLVEQSLILQNGARQNWITLSDDYFNSHDKNQAKRLEKVNQVMDQIKQNEKTVSFSVISIWCQNVELPQIPLDQARTIAQDKITSLQQRITTGEITIEQAGEIIKNDSQLAQIDKNYQLNAFSKYENYDINFINEQAQNSEYFQKLKNLIDNKQIGEISNVYHVRHEASENDDLTEEYYFVFLVEDISGQMTFAEWLDEAKNYFEINLN